MRAQVIINNDYLKTLGIYRYSIVDIVKTHTIRGYVMWYRATYKGGEPIYYKPHEVIILDN